MRQLTVAFLLAGVVSWALAAYAQENITITTYFPAPYGDYNDLNVHRDLIIHDASGGAANTTLTSDNSGNLIVESNQAFQQLVFDDVDRPFAYLQQYDPNGGVTYCANGYVTASFLQTDKTPANPSSLPSSGYMVCLRGWE